MERTFQPREEMRLRRTLLESSDCHKLTNACASDAEARPVTFTEKAVCTTLEDVGLGSREDVEEGGGGELEGGKAVEGEGEAIVVRTLDRELRELRELREEREADDCDEENNDDDDCEGEKESEEGLLIEGESCFESGVESDSNASIRLSLFPSSKSFVALNISHVISSPFASLSLSLSFSIRASSEAKKRIRSWRTTSTCRFHSRLRRFRLAVRTAELIRFADVSFSVSFGPILSLSRLQ